MPVYHVYSISQQVLVNKIHEAQITLGQGNLAVSKLQLFLQYFFPYLYVGLNVALLFYFQKTHL